MMSSSSSFRLNNDPFGSSMASAQALQFAAAAAHLLGSPGSNNTNINNINHNNNSHASASRLGLGNFDDALRLPTSFTSSRPRLLGMDPLPLLRGASGSTMLSSTTMDTKLPPGLLRSLQPQSNNNSNNNNKSIRMTAQEAHGRKRFLVMTKVLFKCLQRSPDPTLLAQAKQVVRECTQRNRAGQPGYAPLHQVTEERLRMVVGEPEWQRAQKCLDLYLDKRGQVLRQKLAAAALGI